MQNIFPAKRSGSSSDPVERFDAGQREDLRDEPMRQEDCKPNCMTDCMEVGNEDKEGTHCTMVLGYGPNGLGWYGSDDNGSDQLGSPMPVRTCQESCEATCNIICMAEGEAREGELGPAAEDRGMDCWSSIS